MCLNVIYTLSFFQKNYGPFHFDCEEIKRKNKKMQHMRERERKREKNCKYKEGERERSSENLYIRCLWNGRKEERKG